MNAFYEHHHNNIRFGYRCFDRILLNGLIQPFQQPERVVGFFSTYRNQYPVSRDVLRGIADQFHNWVKKHSEKWGVPVLDALQGRETEISDVSKANRLTFRLERENHSYGTKEFFLGDRRFGRQLHKHSRRVEIAGTGGDLSETFSDCMSLM